MPHRENRHHQLTGNQQNCLIPTRAISLKDMATDEENRLRIRAIHRREDLVALYKRICEGETTPWDSGKAFEYLVLRAFELEHAEVTWPYQVSLFGSPAEQIDGAVYAVHHGSLWCLIESKDTGEKVNIEPIAKIRNQLLRRPSPAVGLVFSRNGFTEAARTLAQFVAPQSILLWEGPELDHALRRGIMIKGLFEKYRRLIEHGDASFDIRTIEIPAI